MNRMIYGGIVFVLLLAAIIVLLTSPRGVGQELGSLAGKHCVPYDEIVARYTSTGWLVLEDIVLPSGFEADRMLVVVTDKGLAVATPVVNGCVPTNPSYVIPLGFVRLVDGTPA